jgi:hypothetical protein
MRALKVLGFIFLVFVVLSWVMSHAPANNSSSSAVNTITDGP